MRPPVFDWEYSRRIEREMRAIRRRRLLAYSIPWLGLALGFGLALFLMFGCGGVDGRHAPLGVGVADAAPPRPLLFRNASPTEGGAR